MKLLQVSIKDTESYDPCDAHTLNGGTDLSTLGDGIYKLPGEAEERYMKVVANKVRVYTADQNYNALYGVKKRIVEVSPNTASVPLHVFETIHKAICTHLISNEEKNIKTKPAELLHLANNMASLNLNSYSMVLPVLPDIIRLAVEAFNITILR